jgi:adenosylhomocysteine nucleosidase
VSKVIDNSGVANLGPGQINFNGPSAIGANARLTVGHGAPSTHLRSQPGGIGVATMLADETNAVIEVFGLQRDRKSPNGQAFYTGSAVGAAGSVELVAARTLEQGQRSVISTLQSLRRERNPAVFVVLGIGGSIHRDVAIDDVVVATRVVYYELRKVTPGGVQHRGEERQAPAAIAHAVNAFFTDCGEPAELQSGTGGARFRAFSGLIGSGEAVLADDNAEIRRFLSAYNDKILAVDMESGGLSQFCHESTEADQPSWLVIRGISDRADQTKNDAHHGTAARNAALTLLNLIPYLPNIAP